MWESIIWEEWGYDSLPRIIPMREETNGTQPEEMQDDLKSLWGELTRVIVKIIVRVRNDQIEKFAKQKPLNRAGCKWKSAKR